MVSCFAVLAILVIATYLLLCGQGLAASKSITAVVFIFRPGKDFDQATVNLCCGWLSHVGRFHESRIYEFTFDAQLSGGDVEVFLLDQENQPLLKLDRHFPVRRIRLAGECKYYLRWEFRDATGKCQLRWQ